MGPALASQLERRLALFRRMSESVLRARQAIVEHNLEGILETTAEQQSLCGELRRLLAQRAVHGGSRVALARPATPAALSVPLTVPPADSEPVTALCQQLAEAQRELRFAARVNEILLRRSSMTAAALSNLYMSCSGTYDNPRAGSSAGRR